MESASWRIGEANSRLIIFVWSRHIGRGISFVKSNIEKNNYKRLIFPPKIKTESVATGARIAPMTNTGE
jgi:hypothetical protein